MKKFTLLTLLLFFVSMATVIAQQRTISGTVTNAGSGEPLPGANIVVQGTTVGTSTDMKGNFELNIPSEADSLVVSYLGYRTKTLSIGNRSKFAIKLVSDRAMLSEMVVTSFGIEREKRELGYTTQEVDGADLTDAREVDVTNSLAGKVAGVQITGGSTGNLSTPHITIRGESSLSGANRPLIVVDGVPVDNGSTSYSADAQSTQIDFGSSIADINPSDIANINVLKGPNAAALYGSRASNGVILIETKSGGGIEGIGVTFNSNLQVSDILRLPDYQNEYGAGSGGEYKFVNGDGTGGGIDGQGYNWGPPLNGQLITQIGSPRDEDGNLIPIPFEPHPDNVRNFFQRGFQATNNLSVQGSNEDGNFRLSVTQLDQEGIVPNTGMKRNNVSLSVNYDLSDKLNVSGVANYAKTESDNIPTSGYGSENIMYSFIWWGRHLKTSWLEDYWKDGMEGIQQWNFDNNWTNNLFFQVNENTNSLDKDRVFGNVAATYDFTDRLNLRIRSGLDYNDQRTEMRKAFSTRIAPNGRYRYGNTYFLESNTDFLLRYNRDLNQDWSMKVSAGGNHMYRRNNTMTVTAPELSVPEVYNLGNSRTNVSVQQFKREKEINSLYGMLDVNYQEMIYLSVTGRNDWASTLPTKNNSYFYPSVALSTVLSDVFELSDENPLSFAKLRLSWAQVGSDTDPYRLTNTFNYGQPWGSIQAVEESPTLANSDLKPELTNSYEVGTDVRFFDGRLGVDATYYYNSTENQIMSVPLPNSSGYTGRFLNAGEVVNKGVEVVLNATPVQVQNGLNWDVRLNWSRNRSEIVELAEGIDTYQIANPYGGQVLAIEGGRMGDMYGRVFQRSPSGEIIYEDGLPQLTEEIKKVGNYNPDWMAGLGMNFQYKQFTFDFLFDLRYGGRLYSYTHATGIEGGTLTGTTAHRGENVTGDGVVRNPDGSFSQNTESAPYVTWLRRYYARNNLESNSFDATWLKLREVKLGYKFSSQLLQSLPIRNASIALVGRNLFLWTDVPHIDPETTSMYGGEIVPGFEVHQIPSTRSVALDITIQI